MRKRFPEMKNVDVNTLPVEKSQTSLATHYGKREEVNVDGITMPKSWRNKTMHGKKRDGFSLSCENYQRK